MELTQENFNQITEKGVAVVDFWAPWCGPCRMIAPIIKELEETYAGRAVVAKVNTDENQDISVKYNIRSIPTILFFKDGEVVHTVVGAKSKTELSEIIDSLL